jgi:transcriptional regulator with XRE-family HTH domain
VEVIEMRLVPRSRNPRGVRARPGLAQNRLSKGLSQEKVAKITGLSTDTIQRIESQEPEPVSPENLALYGRAVGIEKWEDLVPAPDEARNNLPKSDDGLGAWIKMPPGPWTTTAANGLQWRLYELRHRHIQGRRARGKLYDLSEHLAWRSLDEIEHWLTRHAEVSDRIRGLSPHVGRNIDCFLDREHSQHWWVLDEWIDGPSLRQAIEQRELDSEGAVEVMFDVAEVLQALHREGLVYRALAPRSIFVTRSGAVVTDFELTKIVEGGRTVAPQTQWPKMDVFLAPEVRDRRAAQPSADLFSWAMILAYVLAGKPPGGPVPASEIINRSDLPPDIGRFATACLKDAKNRPASFDGLLKRHRKRLGSIGKVKGPNQ